MFRIGNQSKRIFMYQCRNVKSHRLASSESSPVDKLLYSSIKGLIKDREEKEARFNYLMKMQNEFVDAQTLKDLRQTHNNKDNRPDPSGPIIPIALQYLYKGSTTVQGENKASNTGIKVSDPEQIDIFPFALFDKVKLAEEDLTKSSRNSKHLSSANSEQNVESSDTTVPLHTIEKLTQALSSDKSVPLGRRPRRRRKIDVMEDPQTETFVDRNDDIEIITDNLEPEGSSKKLLSEDEMFKYGSADPEISPSKVPCGKCGAHLHCQDAKMPGFIPVEIFKGKTIRQLRHLHCQRCYIIQTYDIALKMSVSPDDYPKTIAHLKDARAIIVLIVDLTDFPGSVWPNIMELLGKNKRIILVGNKVDLIPQDSKGYLKRIETSMTKTFLKKCSTSGLGFLPRIEMSLLVSARTGFNVETLIDRIYSFWRDHEAYVGGDIYLIGTTNVGKSSLFNLLMDSDLCKVKAIDRVDKALTCPVPGTTLNLLKFPVMRPDPGRLALRRARLQKESKVSSVRESIRHELLRKFKDRRLTSVQGQPVGQTFVHNMDKNIPMSGGGFDIDVTKPLYRHIPGRLDPEDPEFADGKWCYDSPGTISADQIINLLTQEEVMKALPQLPILPRSFSVQIGRTIFIGGIARVDILEGPQYLGRWVPLNLTIFTSDDLPINIVLTENADEFYTEAYGSDLLQVPKGSPDRLKSFPPLEGVELSVDGISRFESSQDIVLSSAGWISCVPLPAQIYKIKAWTPSAKGIFVREPPFLPHAIMLKGDRIKGTPAFKSGKFFIPRPK